MSFEMKQLLVDRSSSILFFLSETVIFLATYIITPLTIVLSLLLSNALFWAVRRLCPNLLPRARLLVAYHWKFLSRVWHGHEIIGGEHLPTTGPALLLFYHGALPVDYYFLVADTLLSKGRIIQSVADKFLFSLPGFRSLMWAWQCQMGSKESLVSLLQQGHLVGLSPGGTYEAQMGDNMYKLMWRARTGFARFTKPFWLWLHDSKKIRGFVPVYGGFPVKLRTFIGQAITFPKGATVEEIRSGCQEALEALVKAKQPLIPGSTLKALAERVI